MEKSDSDSGEEILVSDDEDNEISGSSPIKKKQRLSDPQSEDEIVAKVIQIVYQRCKFCRQVLNEEDLPALFEPKTESENLEIYKESDAVMDQRYTFQKVLSLILLAVIK
jgi:hypothetical protein